VHRLARQSSCRNLVAWLWEHASGRYVAVVNLASEHREARVALPWLDLQGQSTLLRDLLSGDVYERNGDELVKPRLFVAMPPWGYHVLSLNSDPPRR
jgi:hypothetical protein